METATLPFSTLDKVSVFIPARSAASFIVSRRFILASFKLAPTVFKAFCTGIGIPDVFFILQPFLVVIILFNIHYNGFYFKCADKRFNISFIVSEATHFPQIGSNLRMNDLSFTTKESRYGKH